MDFEVIDFEDLKEKSEQTSEEKRPYKHKKKPKKSHKGVLKAIGIFAVIVVVLLSPIFGIKTINADEMKAYSQSEILEIGGISYGENIFLTALTAKGKLEKNPYFEEVSVKPSFPSTLNIEIKERQVRGYISYMGSYLYIDENGLVMDCKTSFKESLPVFTGLVFDKFSVGEELAVDDKEVIKTVVMLTKVFTAYEAADIIDSVDVKDIENIVVTSGSVTVKLGDKDDLDQKIRMMKEILSQIGEEERGTLDLSDLSKPIIFKYLT